MEKSLRIKIKDLIQEAEDSIFENQKVVNLFEKGAKFPKYVEKINDDGLKKAIVHLKNALDQCEVTRNEIKQLALAAISEDQISRMSNVIVDSVKNFKSKEEDLDINKLTLGDEDEKNQWARVLLAYWTLSASLSESE